MNEVAKSVEDPETKGSVWKRWQADRIANGSGDRRNEARSRADLRIGALGSGSDYTPFLQHHGVASLNLSFGGFDEDGIYHSIYDDFYHFSKFSDPGFLYGRALSQFSGSLVVRLAEADVLPFEFTNLADTTQTYCANCRPCCDSGRTTCASATGRSGTACFAAVNDPKEPRPVPTVEDVPPALNFAPLENAVSCV